MTSFWYLIGVSVLLAVTTVCVVLLNAQLERQKETVCYIAMAGIDLMYIGYIGVCFMRLFGIA